MKSRPIFYHDNLGVLQGIKSDCIDLIYLDPPFNKKRRLQHQLGQVRKERRLEICFYTKMLKKSD